MRRTLPVLLLLFVLPATALAREGSPTVEQARQAHGATKPSDRVAGGTITVEPTEGFAGRLETVRVTLAAGAGAVDVAYPGRFSQRAINGRAYVKGTPTGHTLAPGARTVDLDVSGLPAGTYRLPLRRGGKVLGTAVFRLYAQTKEGGDKNAAGPFGPIGRNPVDSSQDSTEESETFVAVNPVDTQRFATYGNDIGSATGTGGPNVTTNGGATWTHTTFPTTFDVKGTAVDETDNPSGDPILAADVHGNVWAGGLATCKSTALVTNDRIFVNRISGTPPAMSAKNVGLGFVHGGGVCKLTDLLQDKPQMTIDNTPTSPTVGRLYVTWDDPDPSGGTNEVLSYCDTQPTPSACDSADNWTNPTVISDTPGSYITSDPAVGPDGRVYVAWWDYSGANAVRIDTCDPSAHAGACNATGDWGTDRIAATLSVHQGRGVPFACPTLAQPGGRAGVVPSLALDHTGGATNGRMYLAWSDLGTAGTHRCTDVSDPPQAGEDAFHSYVASAPDYAALTANPAETSYERGTNVIGDGGDHWFPWVAVDQSTGQAYVDLYSTRDDPTRQTAKFYARAVVPGAGGTRVSYGPLTAVSDDASDYSDQSCCGFGNDYGDYEGLDAAGGNIYAVWTHRLLGDDGDVYVNVRAVASTPTEVPPDDLIPGQPPPPPPPVTTTTTTTTTPPPPPPVVDRTPPVLKVIFATRADRRGRYTLTLKPAGEAAAGNATLRLATGSKRRLASGLLATSGNRSLKLVLRLRSKDLALLRRKHRLRVKLSVSLTDVAGNTARASKAFTLRLSR